MADDILADRPAPTPRPRASTGETVTVGCKMPSGLVLQNYRVEEFDEPLYGGGYRRSQKRTAEGTAITLNGCAVNLGNLAAGITPEHVIAGGYGLTPGVPKDFWDRWYEENKTTKLVTNNIVFIAKDSSSAASQAREMGQQVRSGMEPMDPNKLPADYGRAKLRGGTVSGVQTMGNDTP